MTEGEVGLREGGGSLEEVIGDLSAAASADAVDECGD